MSLKQEERHLPYLIAGCFAANFIMGGIGQAFPNGSFGQLFTWQLSSLLFMSGASLYAAKLHTDKWHISSAGFILLSIGQGIIFTMPNNRVSHESLTMFASAVMVFLPGMIFLCYYSGFPIWLRVLGLVAMLPFLVNMVKIDMQTFDEGKDTWLNVVGFVLIQITSICWGYYVIRPFRETSVQQ